MAAVDILIDYCCQCA